jgi:putative ABC transport system substrate-binding protein
MTGRRSAVAIRVARLLGLGLALLLSPAVGGAQRSEKPARIGVLSGNLSARDQCLDRFRRGLADLGWLEGKTHALEIRWAEGASEPFPRLAAELVRFNVDVLVVFTSSAVPAAKESTTSIPIVVQASYPVELGLVASLSRPGANVTGVALVTPELMAKRVQVLKEVVPTALKLAVLRTTAPVQQHFARDLEAAGRQLALLVRFIEVRGPDDLRAAFQAAVRDGAQAIMSTQAPFFAAHAAQIAALALKHRLPSLSGETGAVDAGTLLSYGPSPLDNCGRLAVYVDRILKGAKPADLPIEQPTKIELAVNLKTAKSLGIAIPPSILARADRIVQ